MGDFIRSVGDFRVNNLANYGVLSDTIEVFLAVAMIIVGIYLTHRIQVWADRAGGEHPGAVNRGQGGGAERYEQRGLRD
ncbi:MAG TPA: hypothetical protein VEQ36_14820 [Thermomicrobiales bacterium]|nr:hypothetical protein [Thermomicrobiales bacterium]